MLQKWLARMPRPVRFLVELFRRGAQENISAYAASAAFFIMLALFPAVMLLTSILSFTPLSQADLSEAVGSILPEALMPLIRYITRDLLSMDSIAVVSVTAVLAIWSASRGVYGVMVGINAVFHTRDGRNYLVSRLICVFYTLFLLLALLLTLALHVFGKLILQFLQARLPAMTGELNTLSGLRFCFSVAFLTLVFTMFYLGFPSRRVRLRHCVPGAVLTAFGWLAFSSFFSIYVSHSSGYSTFYGSLAAFALFMLWLYVCMMILLYGGVLVCMLSERNRRP